MTFSKQEKGPGNVQFESFVPTLSEMVFYSAKVIDVLTILRNAKEQAEFSRIHLAVSELAIIDIRLHYLVFKNE